MPTTRRTPRTRRVQPDLACRTYVNTDGGRELLIDLAERRCANLAALTSWVTIAERGAREIPKALRDACAFVCAPMPRPREFREDLIGAIVRADRYPTEDGLAGHIEMEIWAGDRFSCVNVTLKLNVKRALRFADDIETALAQLPALAPAKAAA